MVKQLGRTTFQLELEGPENSEEMLPKKRRSDESTWEDSEKVGGIKEADWGKQREAYI